MTIEVADFFTKPEGYSWQFDFQEKINWQDEEAKFLAPLRGRVKLIKTDFGALAQFEIATKARLICDRCLKEFDYQVETRFEQDYIADYAKPDNEIIKEEKREGFIIDNRGQIDIGEALRQGLLVSLPLKRLCRQDCQQIKYKR